MPKPLFELMYPTDDPPEWADQLIKRGYVLTIDDSQPRVDEYNYGSAYYLVDLPEGKGARRLKVRYNESEGYKHLDLSKISFVPGYEAIHLADLSMVELALENAPSLSRRSRSPLWDAPGSIVDATKKAEDQTYFYDHGEFGGASQWDVGRVLRVLDGDTQIEISAPSLVYARLFGLRNTDIPAPTLKVRKPSFTSGSIGAVADEAADFLFELELKHGLGIRPKAYSTSPPSRTPRSIGTELSFPTHSYSSEAKDLYWYADGAVGLPLAQFLAYYQILEHFFAAFSREITVTRVRDMLKDQAFNISRSTDVADLLDVAAAVSSNVRETTQLSLTLSVCVEPSRLRRFIRESGLVDHFGRSAQTIEGIPQLRLEAGDEDLLGQLQNRIYRIRNRIVHKKQYDNGEVKSLLPGAEEARGLGPDIALVRWIAERAMVHAAVARASR